MRLCPVQRRGIRAPGAAQGCRRGADLASSPPASRAPCWVDLEGKGRKDLVVGQFNEGKIKVYKNLGDGKFAEGVWLQAGGKVAEVPGVW